MEGGNPLHFDPPVFLPVVGSFASRGGTYMHACVCVFDDSLALWNKSRPVSHL
jgi:hypothetical protein